MRLPATQAGERPDCFGRPSLLDKGCRGCAARRACCAEFSSGLTVRVLARPRHTEVEGEVEREADTAFGAVTRNRLDFDVHQRLATMLIEKAGLTFRIPAEGPYRTVYLGSFSERGQKRTCLGPVCMVVRADRRRVVLHLRRVEAAAAYAAGAEAKSGRRGDDLWVLSGEGKGKGLRRLLRKLEDVMRASLASGTFMPVIPDGDQDRQSCSPR